MYICNISVHIIGCMMYEWLSLCTISSEEFCIHFSFRKVYLGGYIDLWKPKFNPHGTIPPPPPNLGNPKLTCSTSKNTTLT